MQHKPLLIAVCSILLVGGWIPAQQDQSEARIRELEKKWFAVKGWEGTYSSTFSNEKTTELGGGVTVTTSIGTQLTASAVLDQNIEAPSRGYGEFYGVGTATWVETKETVMVQPVKGGKVTIIESIHTEQSGKIGGGEDEDEFGASLFFDLYSGTYSVGFATPTSDAMTTVKRSIKGMPTNYSVLQQAPEPYRSLFGKMGTEMENYVNYEGPIENAGPLLTGVVSMLAMKLFPDFNKPTEYDLPENGLLLSDSYSGKNETEQWRIAPIGMAKFMELQTCPKEWMPDPDPDIPFYNSVPIEITGEGWMGEPARLRITLFEVTKEDGLAINYLGDERPRDAFDLDFKHSDNERILGNQRELEDGYEIETKDKVKNLKFYVSSYDGAAWGKLKVEAKLDDDSDEWFQVLTPAGKEYITIPLDERGGFENRIADSWEINNHLEEGIDGFEDDELDLGDGLSLHEEYRGYYVKSSDGPFHLRGNVRKLEVFIMCEDDLLAKAALKVEKAFPNVTIKLLDSLCAPPMRIVNAYATNENKNGDQHYVRMYRGHINSAGLVGVTHGNGMEHWTPGDVEKIIIDVAKIREFETSLDQIVVHEVFHAIGVLHHGPDNKRLRISTKANPSPQYDSVVATYGGTNSGRVECVMCYTDADFFEDENHQLAKDEQGEPIKFKATHEFRKTDFLCIDNKGSQYNANGGQVGDASEGYCTIQIRVRDFDF